MPEDIIFAIAGIGLVGIVCQWLAWRVKLPAILFLLLAGIVAGPLLGWLKPDHIFGSLLLPIISLSVAVILFEGSLTLKFTEIHGLQTVVRRLVSTGLLVTWITISLATHWLLDFSWKLSFLFGAITVVTGPTVVVPMLRAVKPTANVANILRWEGIVIDPVGALFAVLVFQFIISKASSDAIGQALIIFFKTLAFSSLIGGLAGYSLGLFIRNHWLPDFLHSVTALALVFGVFAAANAVQPESGLLAVTIMGVWLTNMERVPTEDILNFKESLSIILISGLFIILASRINLNSFYELGWPALWVFLAIQFIARPANALLSTWQTPLSWGERLLIAWIAPRGIVAAATAAVFAVHLQKDSFRTENLGAISTHFALTHTEYEQAGLLVPLTFIVIIGTVVLQSITSRFIALKLGVAQPEAKGILIVGANALAREIAKALRECGYDVLLADTNGDNIRAARMDGLETYYGNVVSEHADQQLELIGIGHLLALSEHPEINMLACQRYRPEFGRQAIYSIQSENTSTAGVKSHFALAPKARLLFGKEINIQKLEEMLNSDARIHKTILTEQHNFQSFLESHQQDTVILFAVPPNGKIEFVTIDHEITPKLNWTVVSLVQPELL